MESQLKDPSTRGHIQCHRPIGRYDAPVLSFEPQLCWLPLPGSTRSEATLLFTSPKFRTIPSKKEYDGPTLADEGTLYSFYDRAEQQDLVPTLSGLMGLPIPRNDIGKVWAGFENWEAYVDLLERNAQQLWSLVDAVLGREILRSKEIPQTENASQFFCQDSSNTADKLACLLKVAEQQAEQSGQTQRWDEARISYDELLTQAQQALIDGIGSFSIFHMAVGMFL
jgi:ethanolaminephosphotransferase